MPKTLQLISKYFSLLAEQVPQEAAPAADPSQLPPQEQPTPVTNEPVVSNIDKNERYVIKILTNAFIFNPNKFVEDKQKYKYIFNKIDSIEKMVNVPVSKIVREIKKIIALDKSLRIESKTLKIINKYIFLLEQPADATEPQDAIQPSQSGISPKAEKGNASEDDNNLNLAEIFPLYQELILKALRHSPSEDELMIVKPIVNNFANVDPEKIVEAIQGILKL
jgi:hypothetical protein